MLLYTTLIAMAFTVTVTVAMTVAVTLALAEDLAEIAIAIADCAHEIKFICSVVNYYRKLLLILRKGSFNY